MTQEYIGSVVMKGVVFSGGTNLLLRILDIIIAILLLRWLSIYEYGVYRLTLAAFDFGTGFFLSGLESVVISDVSGTLNSNPRSGKVLLSTYMLLMACIGVFLWVVFFFGFSWLEGSVSRGTSFLWIISFLFLLAPLETVYKWQFQIQLEFGWAALFRLMREVARLLLMAGAFFLASFGIREALWTLVISGILPVIIAFFMYRRPLLFVVPRFGEIRNAFSNLFIRHGKWAIADDFFSNTGKSIRPFIIKTFAGTEAVAIFSVAQNFLAYTTSLFPIREVLTSVFPRQLDDKARLAEQVRKSAKYSTFAHIILGVLGAVGTSLVIYILFPKYEASLPLYLIMVLGLPWLGYRSVMNPVFYALQEQRNLFLLTALRLLIVTVLGVILVYSLGVWGAALEVLILNILLTPTFSRAIKRILPEWRGSFSDLFVFDAYDRLVLAGIWSRMKQKIFPFI